MVMEPEALPKLARLGLLGYVQGQSDPVCGDYSIKYLSPLKKLRVKFTFEVARVWEVTTISPDHPTPRVLIRDEHHMVKEVAEIIEEEVGHTRERYQKVPGNVESLTTLESKESASDNETMHPQRPKDNFQCQEEQHMVPGKVESQSTSEVPKKDIRSSSVYEHAMTALGGMLTSAILKMVCQQIGSVIGRQITMQPKLKNDLEYMKIALELVDAVLVDAESMSITDIPVRLWLKALKDAMYDISALMDEFDSDNQPATPELGLTRILSDEYEELPLS
ncbi:hypothetical protein ACQ4PT_068772 [Festuca glaucescens]